MRLTFQLWADFFRACDEALVRMGTSRHRHLQIVIALSESSPKIH
jgi:hypothetical protein